MENFVKAVARLELNTVLISAFCDAWERLKGVTGYRFSRLPPSVALEGNPRRTERGTLTSTPRPDSFDVFIDGFFVQDVEET